MTLSSSNDQLVHSVLDVLRLLRCREGEIVRSAKFLANMDRFGLTHGDVESAIDQLIRDGKLERVNDNAVRLTSSGFAASS